MPAGFQIKIRAETYKVETAFRHLALSQIPFAATKALNASAKDAARAARRDLKRKFTVRRKRGNQGIRIRNARKSEYPRRGAEIQWIDYLARHQKGGRQRPKRGRAFAIPTRFITKKRKKSGELRQTYKPRHAIAKGTAVVEQRPRIGGVVARKPTKRRSKSLVSRLRIWHLFRRKITLKPVLDARGAVLPSFRRRYPLHFRIEFARALRTARR